VPTALVGEIDLKPPALRDFIVRNAGAPPAEVFSR